MGTAVELCHRPSSGYLIKYNSPFSLTLKQQRKYKNGTMSLEHVCYTNVIQQLSR